MSDNAKSTIKTICVAIFFVVIILVFFNSLGNRSSQKRTEKEETEVTQLCDYDMIGNYPKTPRDLVKLHNRFYKVFYGEKFNVTDDELYILNQQIRNLYAKELLLINDETTNLLELEKSIENMKKEKYSYNAYELPEASQVVYYTQNGVEMASLEVTITVDMDDSMGYLYVQYVLVKENDQWKIYAWGETQMHND